MQLLAHLRRHVLTHCLLPILVLLITGGLVGVGGSKGDERAAFVACVAQCGGRPCQLSWILRVTQWDCLADCKYRCITEDVATGAPIVQYYGKWPFVRLLGAQELFSVLFSLGNLVAHLYGYFHIYRASSLRQTGHYGWMNRIHQTSLWLGCNAWLQSTIFHYRDTPLTEKLDYFSAGLCICAMLPVAVIRIGRIRSGVMQLAVFAPMLTLYLHHLHYMTFVHFDYGYHVKLHAVIGMLCVALWLWWAVHECRHGSRQLGWSMLRFLAANVATTAMVAVDFPPLFRLVDMHALWHLSTIPVTLLWYQFIRADCDLSAIQRGK